jgi:hypothetical protein
MYQPVKLHTFKLHHPSNFPSSIRRGISTEEINHKQRM